MAERCKHGFRTRLCVVPGCPQWDGRPPEHGDAYDAFWSSPSASVGQQFAKRRATLKLRRQLREERRA